jgi:hypothetical protein
LDVNSELVIKRYANGTRQMRLPIVGLGQYFHKARFGAEDQSLNLLARNFLHISQAPILKVSLN